MGAGCAFFLEFYLYSFHCIYSFLLIFFENVIIPFHHFETKNFDDVSPEIRRRTEFRTMTEGNKNGISSCAIILEVYSANVITLQVRVAKHDPL
jgi:hypothetical protein